MRLVKVKVPEGQSESVAAIAFVNGIEQVCFHTERAQSRDGRSSVKEVVEVETSTPTAKRFMDAVMTASFFDPETCSMTVRQPRSIVSRPTPSEVTWPLVEPTADIFEELWQFSHVTFGVVGRVFIAGCLLAYGLIQDHLLLIIAGLMFAPFLPVLMAISFGLLTRQWKLAAQALAALAVTLLLVFAAGVTVDLLASRQPVRFHAFEPQTVGCILAFITGIAAALANADDAGRRELIGLAAAAQVAVFPAWFGVGIISGFPQDGPPGQRLLSLLLNLLAFLVAAFLTHAALGFRAQPLRKFSSHREQRAG